MTDTFDKETRSRIMSSIRSKDTKPEVLVRSELHRMGYRFRIHRRDLPGTPDIVLPRFKTIIFVHGCFWHSHKGCKYAVNPKSNTEYWTAKLQRNRARDADNVTRLEEAGWSVLTVWECEVGDGLEDRLRRFLEG
jgi:DNA mismatch endonuclease (patch repair protein)